MYGAPATVYCDSVTLIFACIIIIIIIIIIIKSKVQMQCLNNKDYAN